MSQNSMTGAFCYVNYTNCMNTGTCHWVSHEKCGQLQQASEYFLLQILAELMNSLLKQMQ